jgi:hypothetical protein
MAYSSRSSRSSRPTSRGAGARGRPSPRRGGNPGATIGAVVVVVGVIAAIAILTSKGKDKPKVAPTTVAPPPRTGAEKPAEPQRPPPPPVSEEIKTQARTLVTEAQELAKQGESLYAEAVAAKNKGDDDLWQQKLREAQQPFQEILDRWNEIIAQMPTDLPHGWDEEEVANYWLGKEGDQITKMIGRAHDISKQLRLR